MTRSHAPLVKIPQASTIRARPTVDLQRRPAAVAGALPRYGIADLPITDPVAQRAIDPSVRVVGQGGGGVNRTGLPGRLKTGIEAMSGVSMDSVRVRYNSPQPSQLGALAYARGREIHVAPGQEAHLPHEAWHLVQQAHGRVRPTQWMNGLAINADQGLEREADRMGARAMARPVGQAAASHRLASLPIDAPAQLMTPWWQNALLGAGFVGGLATAGAGAFLGATGVMAAGAVVAGGSALAAYLSSGSPSAAGPVTNGDWYADRHTTAYGHTNPRNKTGLQGPHYIPHVAKKLMAERSVARNPLFDPSSIPERTGALPSAGQSRHLLQHHETTTGTPIPMAKKKAHDAAYKDALHRRQHAPTAAERVSATAEAMELNPLATYAHGRIATHAEIKGKGERRSTVAPDLDKMEQMQKGGPAPSFAKVDHGTGAFKPAHLSKLQRDTGRISLGQADLSELDTDSDSSYS